MKEIGTTPDGNFIVEMSRLERSILSQLEDAASGQTIDWYHAYEGHQISKDASPWLAAVHTWTMTQFSINELQLRLDRLKAMLIPK